MRIGDLLLSSEFITEEELNAALKHQKATKKTPIGQLLKLLNYLKEDELELVLQAQRKILFASMSDRLAIAGLKYAKENRVSFSDAAEKVLATEKDAEGQPFAEEELGRKEFSFAPASSGKISPSLARPSGIANPSGPRFAVDPLELIQKADNAAAEKDWEYATALMEQARSVYEKNNGFEEEAIIPVYCRLAAFYSKIGRTANAQENINKATDLINKGIPLSPGSTSLLAAAAHLCSRHGMIAEANRLYRIVMPKWAQLLPFELTQFNLCLRDAIACSSAISPPGRHNIRIGELLTNAGLIDKEQFLDSLQTAKSQRQPLGRILSEQKFLNVQDLRNAMKVQLICRAAALPVDYAAITVKAASYAGELTGDFFGKLNIPLETTNSDPKTLATLISKMDELLLLEEKRGIQDPKVARLAAEVGVICLQRGENEEAEAMFRRAHAVFAISGDEFQAELAVVCQSIGRLIIKQKKYPEAELLFLQAMEIKNRIHGEKHAEVGEALTDVGYLYFCQANYTPAIGFLRSAWLILSEDGSAEKKRFVLELLIKCFEQSGQEAESEVYKEQLRAIRFKDI